MIISWQGISVDTVKAKWNMAFISWCWDSDDNSELLDTRRPYSRVEPVELHLASNGQFLGYVYRGVK